MSHVSYKNIYELKLNKLTLYIFDDVVRLSRRNDSTWHWYYKILKSNRFGSVKIHHGIELRVQYKYARILLGSGNYRPGSVGKPVSADQNDKRDGPVNTGLDNSFHVWTTLRDKNLASQKVLIAVYSKDYKTQYLYSYLAPTINSKFFKVL